VKWLSKKLMEYDIENDFWTETELRLERNFFPFSRSVYLPNQDIIVLGGMDDADPYRPVFTERVFMIQEVPKDSYDNVYLITNLKPMQMMRGCFAAIYHEGWVWAFGGVNYQDKVSKKCERYNVEQDDWKRIPDMNTPRKNASACALSADTIYVFGGTSQVETLDTIEQFSISTHVWTVLRVKMPIPAAFMSTFKVSDSEIILMGGMVRDLKNLSTYKTSEALVFNVVRGKFKRLKQLDHAAISLHPVFYDDGQVFMIEEEGVEASEIGDSPKVLRYDISRLI